MSPPYPTVYQIEEMFANRMDYNTFHTYLADNPDLTVVGKDFHLAGNHKSAETWHTDMFLRLVDAFKEDTIRLQVVPVIGGDESAWASVESVAMATNKYDKEFHHEWVDLVRFDSKGKIALMKEFFDSEQVTKHLDHHESQEKQAE